MQWVDCRPSAVVQGGEGHERRNPRLFEGKVGKVDELLDHGKVEAYGIIVTLHVMSHALEVRW